jgi:hypothetical protein
MPDCERCDGNGTIDGAVSDLACPNCTDACQWCNRTVDDGEELGNTGLSVCRQCIRDMAGYKEDISWMFLLDSGVSEVVDDVEQLRLDIDAAISDVFESHGANAESGEWDVQDE